MLNKVNERERRTCKMDMIKAMIYGVVEGITEWLPVSSTGHMILLERLLPFQGVGEDFFNVFDVVIQLGAMVAFTVSIVVLRFFISYVKKHDFQAFGYYRIVLGMIVLLCGCFGIL